MVVGFTTTYAIHAYHHWSCEFEPRLWQGVLDTLCDKVCQWLATSQWFSPVSSTKKTDRHDINWNIVESGIKHHKPTNEPFSSMKKQSTGRETWQSTAIHNPSPPVFVLLLNAACKGEKQQIANLVIGLTLEFNPQSTTRVHHYITEAVSVMVLNTTFNNISIKSWQSVLLQDSQR